MKIATLFLLGALTSEGVQAASVPDYDCSKSPFPKNTRTCWADEAYQRCGAAQWAYDYVMTAGGSGKAAWYLTKNLEKGQCSKCDISKADCKYSKHTKKENSKTCWGDTAFQTCASAKKSQAAYDEVMKISSNNNGNIEAYCYHEGLKNSNCALLDYPWSFTAPKVVQTNTGEVVINEEEDQNNLRLVETYDDFACSMDGYKRMTLQAIDLSLFALALIKESYAAILPTDLGKSVNYAWEGLTGVGAWLGYAAAAGYYFGKEAGYGAEICEYSGIAYTIINAVHGLVNFSEEEN